MTEIENPSNRPRPARRSSAFFEAPTRGIKELGALRSLIESLRHANLPSYTSPELSGQDPPDCVATNAAGEKVGFEVTELASEQAIRANEQRPVSSDPVQEIHTAVYKQWQPAELRAHISQRLREKDAKLSSCQGYADLIVVFHTDEFDLDFQAYEPILRATRFGKQQHITGAFVLFSYDPRVCRCPFVGLSLT